MTNQHTTNFSGLPLIIAVDFDGTIVKDEFPEIGEEIPLMVDVLKKIKELNIKLILWTSRTGSYLKAAVDWCAEKDLYFDAINENIQEVKDFTGMDTRKVYADIYLDDKNRNIDPHVIYSNLETYVEWLGK